MVDAFGAVTWWGFSPCLPYLGKDLVSSFSRQKINKELHDGQVNVLLVGAGDLRHVLPVICDAWKEPKQKYTIYLIENNMEVYARHLLFLHLFLESPASFGLQEKTEMFLELFGNSLIRQQTSEYLASTSTQLIKYATDLNHLEKHLPLVDLSCLKFKERDQLEAVFKFWRNTDRSIFDISKCWENRLRTLLGQRYDSRSGSYDWDYNMKLLERGADIMHKKEYSHWRETGVAFTIREATYDVPNRTLASGLLVNKGGEKVPLRGYWGDIVASPYLAFGIESENKALFKKANDAYAKTSQDVSEFNILSLLHSLTHHEKYQPPDPKDTHTKKQEASLAEIVEEEDEEGAEESTETLSMIQVVNVKIVFLPLGSAKEIHKKSKYRSLFDIVFFSNSMVHTFTEDITATFADKGSIVCETAKFMLELKKEKAQEFVSKVGGIAKAAGCTVDKSFNGLKDNVMAFMLERQEL